MAFDPSIIRDPRQKRFHAYWCQKAAGREMPRRADVDPVDFAWMLGWITLVEPLPDGDWRFVVDGSNIAAVFGVDMTGKRVSEYPVPAVRDVMSTTFAAAAAARGPYFLTYDIEHDLRRWRYDGLLLPLCGDDGGIDRLISTVVLEDGGRR
jgi:hypothetical protein